MNSSTSHLDPDAQRLLDDARGRWQRRRATIYCVFGAILNCLWFGSTLSTWALEEAPTFSDRLDVASTLLLGVIYAVAAIGFWRMRPDPDQVARRLGWMLIVAGVMVVVAVMLVLTFDADLNDPQFTPLLRTVAAAATSLLFIFAIHFVAALFVALPPWPAFWPLIPLWVAYAAGVFSLEGTSLGVRALLAGLFPLAGAPGLIWSVVRHQRWVDRFKIDLLGDRYSAIRQDLAEARRVHEAILPPPIEEGPLRLRYAYEPMREIGGDFLFCRRTADDSLLLVVVDVTGHGVVSALAVTRIHAVLSLLAGSDTRLRPARAASTSGGAVAPPMAVVDRPGALLARLNAFVEEALAPQAVYATAVAIVVDPRRGELRWASAGHPPAIVRRAQEPHASGPPAEHLLVELPSTCPMLGVQPPGEFDADEQSMPLAPGDSVVLFTDGVIESFGADGGMFGIARLRDALRTPAPNVARRVLDAVGAFRNGPPADDTLVVELSTHPAG